MYKVEKKYLKWSFRPIFSRERQLPGRLIGIEKGKYRIKLNKSIYTGVVILASSKNTMSDFHCDFIKATYGGKAKMLFTDTENFYFIIETKYIYKDF